MKLKINQLQQNNSNPRLIKGEKFKKLVKSIKDFPQMLELRPIVIDENNTIIADLVRQREELKQQIDKLKRIQRVRNSLK